MSTAAIQRSPGVPVHVGVIGAIVGGGLKGASDELDALVQGGAELLAELFAMPVTIRFNSDRESGGAWLLTHERDRVGANAEVGICAHLVTERRHRDYAQMIKRYGEDPEFPPPSPVGTLTLYVRLRARVMPEQFRHLCVGSYKDDSCNLPVPDLECAGAVLAAFADVADIDYAAEA